MRVVAFGAPALAKWRASPTPPVTCPSAPQAFNSRGQATAGGERDRTALRAREDIHLGARDAGFL